MLPFATLTLALILASRFEGLAADLWGMGTQLSRQLLATHDGCPVHHNGGFTP